MARTISHILSLFTFFVMVTHHIQPASADCCPCPVNSAGSPTKCNDGTKCVPYCGYGQCNIFGCNCDGGCRKAVGAGEGRRRRGNPLLLSRDDEESGDLFDQADLDGDGILTKEEWFQALMNTDLSKEELEDKWNCYDVDGNEVLTRDQAITRGSAC
ncbi:hypothetical protein BD779DRAFT_282031 [Infundibulicybe gibba]|nr:hypothetical protein BD779DRAFT_282031 [Infundibulicybe gibba]